MRSAVCSRSASWSHALCPMPWTSKTTGKQFGPCLAKIKILAIIITRKRSLAFYQISLLRWDLQGLLCSVHLPWPPLIPSGSNAEPGTCSTHDRQTDTEEVHTHWREARWVRSGEKHQLSVAHKCLLLVTLYSGCKATFLMISYPLNRKTEGLSGKSEPSCNACNVTRMFYFRKMLSWPVLCYP